jgi:hypothetical protein
VLELRGDEALAVFGSARQALRAVLALQTRCARETQADPTLPLNGAMGLDALQAGQAGGGLIAILLRQARVATQVLLRGCSFL